MVCILRKGTGDTCQPCWFQAGQPPFSLEAGVPSPQACTRTSKQAYSHLSLNLLQSRTKAQSVLNREIMKTFFELPPPVPTPRLFLLSWEFRP